MVEEEALVLHAEEFDPFFVGKKIDNLEVFAVSCTTGENLDQFRAYLFEFLNVVRVYSKVPGKKADKKKKPMSLPCSK